MDNNAATNATRANALVAAARQRPGLTGSQLCRAADSTYQSAKSSLWRLQAKGVLVKTDGKFFVNEELAHLVNSFELPRVCEKCGAGFIGTSSAKRCLACRELHERSSVGAVEQELLELQRHTCPICLRSEEELTELAHNSNPDNGADVKLKRDYSADGRTLRAWLCTECRTGLRSFEAPERLGRALHYLAGCEAGVPFGGLFEVPSNEEE